MEKYYWLNKHSRQFLERGYLSEGVTPEKRIREISENAEKILKIDGFADKFEDYLARGFYSLSTPVWTNFGNKRGLPVSCFGSAVSDTLEEILNKVAEVGTMSKLGGGTSGFFGDLRSRGSKISVGGESSGPVHFMELFDTVAEVVSQGSARRGSFAAYLPIEHPDIEEFLQIRSKGHAIQNMSIGVTISDGWMNSMLEGDKDKRKIWSKVIQKRFETGYPYIQFSDTVNNNSPQVYKDKDLKIKASNLCVAPETLLLTDEGHKIIAELEGEEVNVWNGKQWSKTRVEKTGENQSLVKVTLSDGKELTCTPYHKWYVMESYNQWRKGKYLEKRTHELKEGDKIIKFDAPVITDADEEFKYPYTHGAFTGDGTYKSGRPIIYLYGEKDKVIDYLDYHGEPRRGSCGRLHLNLPKDLAKKFSVPHNSSIETKLRWLEGYLDMDGTVAKNGPNESIQVSCVEQEFLKEVQLLLQTLGVNSKIIHGADEGERLMPDGKGGHKMFLCKETKRLLITSIGLYQLISLGFSPKRLKVSNHLPQREAERFVKVVSVVDEGRKDDTYCCNEPLQHKAVFNGILTGNCSEIELFSDKDNSFVCVLSSINLLHWDEIVKTDAVETLIYFLDAVNEEFVQKTEGIKFMESAHNFAKTQRALGAGVLGWHSLLQSKDIAFESMEAKILNSQIWKIIRDRADKATIELANIFGEPELLKGYGRRNVTTLACAPTTSSSFILGQVSPSIEPENSNYYVKKLAKGSFTYKNPYLKAVLKSHDKNTDETWQSILVKGGSVNHLDFLSEHEKNVFKTFGEISQKEIVIQASQRQKYIDQSQSLNLMIPFKAKPKEVSELLIEGWRLGVKTFYYQRSTSPTQELVRSLTECVSCSA